MAAFRFFGAAVLRPPTCMIGQRFGRAVSYKSCGRAELRKALGIARRRRGKSDGLDQHIVGKIDVARFGRNGICLQHQHLGI